MVRVKYDENASRSLSPVEAFSDVPRSFDRKQAPTKGSPSVLVKQTVSPMTAKVAGQKENAGNPQPALKEQGKVLAAAGSPTKTIKLGQPTADQAGPIGFSNKELRRAFIRKVYVILSVQLAITAGIASGFIFVEPVKQWVLQHWWICLVALIIYIPLYCILACCVHIRRTFPLNLILLLLVTLAMGFFVGVISCTYSTLSVILALGITAGCCVAVTFFAFNTKFDFTSCAGVLFVLGIVLVLFGLIVMFVNIPVLHKIYAGVGALICMLYLAFDTQMVMGGKEYELSPEDYIFGALTLYTDIINIFLFMLKLTSD